MRVLSVSWNGNSDITKVKFTEEFLEDNWIIKADILKDLIHIFQKQYDEILTSDIPVAEATNRSEQVLRNWKYE
jgi:hypothetical protein